MSGGLFEPARLIRYQESKTMKLKYMFEKMELDGEMIAVPVGAGATELHAVLNVNEEAMRILELLQVEITEEEIVDQLMEEYEGDKDEIASLVQAYIDQLRREDLLEE